MTILILKIKFKIYFSAKKKKIKQEIATHT